MWCRDCGLSLSCARHDVAVESFVWLVDGYACEAAATRDETRRKVIVSGASSQSAFPVLTPVNKVKPQRRRRQRQRKATRQGPPSHHTCLTLLAVAG